MTFNRRCAKVILQRLTISKSRNKKDMKNSRLMFLIISVAFTALVLEACSKDSDDNLERTNNTNTILTDTIVLYDSELDYKEYTPKSTDRIVSRTDYVNKLYGFWLGECIANWTGLITEMDKIGNIGSIKTGDFYTRDQWGKADLKNIWNKYSTSRVMDFVFMDESEGTIS